jgi:hypothetical protein
MASYRLRIPQTDLPSLRLTFDISDELTLGELKTVCRLAELSGWEEDDGFFTDADENDNLRGFSFYIKRELLEHAASMPADERFRVVPREPDAETPSEVS